MKKTIQPISVQPAIDTLIDIINQYGDLLPEGAVLEAQSAIKILKANFIDIASLIRVSSFAAAYGKHYMQRSISKQAIYQKIDKGLVPEILIDEVKFIDKTTLHNGT